MWHKSGLEYDKYRRHKLKGLVFCSTNNFKARHQGEPTILKILYQVSKTGYAA